MFSPKASGFALPSLAGLSSPSSTVSLPFQGSEGGLESSGIHSCSVSTTATKSPKRDF